MRKTFFLFLLIFRIPAGILAADDPVASYALNLFGRLTASLSNQDVFLSPAALRTDLNLLFEATGPKSRASLTRETGLKTAPAPLSPEQRTARETTFRASNLLAAPPDTKFKKNILNRSGPGTIREVKGGAESHALHSFSPSSLLLSTLTETDFRFSAFLGEMQIKPIPFTAVSGERTLPGVQFSGFYGYTQTPALHAVTLPDDSGRFQLVLVQTRSGHSLGDLCRNLSPRDIAAWTSEANEAEGYIVFPLLLSERLTRLEPVLSRSGLAPLFDRRQADFSGLSTQRLFLEHYEHKARFRFTQTDDPPLPAYMDPRTFTQHEFFNFIASGPFLLILKDARTAEILLLGLVREP